VRTKRKSTGGSLVELVVIVATALVLALIIQWLFVKPYRIPSGSMEPTLHVGQRVLVNRIEMRFTSPGVGDIVVFHPPAGADNGDEDQQCGDPNRPAQAPCDRPTAKESSQNFIKRIVAGPGDTIAIVNGHVIRNGKRVKESYTAPCGGAPGCDLPQAIRVPPGHYFMMGDNRGDSDDSRFWGPVPKKWIIGSAFATYWPPDRIGIF